MKPRSRGGLLLLRRKAPLKRHSVVYFAPALITTLFFASNLVIFYLFGQTGMRIGVVYYIWVGIFNWDYAQR
jgi:hypothetical protein